MNIQAGDMIYNHRHRITAIVTDLFLSIAVVRYGNMDSVWNLSDCEPHYGD